SLYQAGLERGCTQKRLRRPRLVAAPGAQQPKTVVRIGSRGVEIDPPLQRRSRRAGLSWNIHQRVAKLIVCFRKLGTNGRSLTKGCDRLVNVIFTRARAAGLNQD